ncbi:MAG: SDR family NAD(P)-dependent oxidoreductase [Beijerinckiaceae bacterium]|nr:SDR family NAD(P)-dependent oxidoreductase [Beijerinckiaceae bacterium]MCZ8300181.1 SDR family NAD(P)-dependent oxidoreductase [Beijerinckiaceae bacterium]
MPERQRHALVTGASSGIGAAVTHRLLAEGWRVTGLSRRPAGIGHPAFSGRACDLLDPAERQRALGGLGSVDALIHAAGLLRGGTLGALEPEAQAAMWQVHVAAAEDLANILVPAMGEGGRLVLIGSRTANGAAGRSQYAATKAALVGMVRSWAIELAPRGITANIVAPAATATPMLEDPARATIAVKMPPIGRLIRPEEVAAAVVFLLSPEAGAITGQVLTICGGSSL